MPAVPDIRQIPLPVDPPDKGPALPQAAARRVSVGVEQEESQCHQDWDEEVDPQGETRALFRCRIGLAFPVCAELWCLCHFQQLSSVSGGAGADRSFLGFQSFQATKTTTAEATMSVRMCSALLR